MFPLMLIEEIETCFGKSVQRWIENYVVPESEK